MTAPVFQATRVARTFVRHFAHAQFRQKAQRGVVNRCRISLGVSGRYWPPDASGRCRDLSKVLQRRKACALFAARRVWGEGLGHGLFLWRFAKHWSMLRSRASTVLQACQLNKHQSYICRTEI